MKLGKTGLTALLLALALLLSACGSKTPPTPSAPTWDSATWDSATWQ